MIKFVGNEITAPLAKKSTSFMRGKSGEKLNLAQSCMKNFKENKRNTGKRKRGRNYILHSLSFGNLKEHGS
jgi:hypothetical protein